MARPRLCPAWGKGVAQKDGRTHFLNSETVTSDFLWSPRSGSSLFAPAALLGKALVQEALLGSGEVRSPSKPSCPLFSVAVEGPVPGPA